jgi:hypothetical protein
MHLHADDALVGKRLAGLEAGEYRGRNEVRDKAEPKHGRPDQQRARVVTTVDPVKTGLVVTLNRPA